MQRSFHTERWSTCAIRAPRWSLAAARKMRRRHQRRGTLWGKCSSGVSPSFRASSPLPRHTTGFIGPLLHAVRTLLTSGGPNRRHALTSCEPGTLERPLVDFCEPQLLRLQYSATKSIVGEGSGMTRAPKDSAPVYFTQRRNAIVEYRIPTNSCQESESLSYTTAPELIGAGNCCRSEDA